MCTVSTMVAHDMQRVNVLSFVNFDRAEELVIVSGTGPQCVFPFTYKGVEYTECTDVDVWYGTWCATTDDFENNPDMWMRC